ncbi:MAG: hypothetical protein LBS36_10995 [Oscillospiraceae bacterium]|jgi:hypothetical protein|nr:hypothetical protein [Oscillospiraceae bacterium]
MKIEIGESLMLSWLRHVKECRIVQTNWKASPRWELQNRDILENLMERSSAFFQSKYGYNLYKGNSGLPQMITQAEIDVLGISFDADSIKSYAVDVAFHEAGLNYGAKEETVSRVVKKYIRTAMCLSGYYGFDTGSIIFASPKINPSIMEAINMCVSDILNVLHESGLNFDIRIIANEAFSDQILKPVLSALGDVSDTSELFMRSLQMYNLFSDKKPAKDSVKKSVSPYRISPALDKIEQDSLSGLDEMKIGAIVRNTFSRMLEDGKASEHEISLMQTKEYSKETFDIQYPLLVKAEKTDGSSPPRYYSSSIKINNENYFLCSEWFEVPANNDRPYLMKWIALHMK